MAALIVAGVLVLFAIFLAARTIRIIPQARAGVVERLGRYSRTLQPGLTTVKLTAVRTANVAHVIAAPPPARSTAAAPAAPIANGNRKKLRLITSATAKTTATMSQMTQASILR